MNAVTPVAPSHRSLAELQELKAGLSREIASCRHAGEPCAHLIQQSRDLTAQIKQIDRQRATMSAAADGPPRLEVVDSVAGIGALRGEWQELARRCPCAHLHVSWEWLDAWYAAYAAAGQIRCLTARDPAGQLIGLAPLFHPHRGDDSLSAAQIGLAGTYGPAWGHYPEFLILPEHEATVMDLFLDTLWEGAGAWHTLKLLRVDPRGRLLGLLAAHAPAHRLRLLAQPRLQALVHPLPDDPAGVISSFPGPKLRNRCRVAQRHLAQEHPAAWVGGIDDPAEQDRVLAELPQLNIMRHEGKSRQSHFSEAPYLACYERATAHYRAAGWLRVGAMTIDGRIVGATVCARHGDWLHVLHSGFDPACARYSPSHLILIALLEREVAAGARWMDMQIHYPYKAGLCSASRQLADVLVFPETLNALAPVTAGLLERTIRAAGRVALGHGLHRHPRAS